MSQEIDLITPSPHPQLAILGAGAWGKALAICASHNQQKLWIFDRGTNKNHFGDSDVLLPNNIIFSSNLHDFAEVKFLAIAVPAQHVRELMLKLKEVNFTQHLCFIICCKGIEMQSGKLCSEIVHEFFPSAAIAVLAGANFALEVAQGKSSTTTLACKDKLLANTIKQIFQSTSFALEIVDDIIAVQIAGALKNVIAIASGLAAGLSLGENAQAAIIAQGTKEMAELCIALKGDINNLFSSAGIGDLFLTCTSRTSRNMDFGFQLASNNEQLTNNNKTVEGYKTIIAWRKLVHKFALNAPLLDAIFDITYNQAPARLRLLTAMNWDENNG